MKFAIITHVEHIKQGDLFYAYSPYVREMNIWMQHVEEVTVVATMVKKNVTAIHLPYQHDKILFQEVKKFNLTSFKNIAKAIVIIPSICMKIYKAMKDADHIHLRCPGNMGLLGSIMQIFFPSKIKTAKYAGNWDPKSRQPFTYRLQKWIISNTFLTKNMQVLVYGDWPDQTKNIKPFFTATYKESDKTETEARGLSGKIEFIFVGTLSSGKRPLFAIKLIEKLYQQGNNIGLKIFGEGFERGELEAYIKTHDLTNVVVLQGNQTTETVKEAYTKSHFLILASKSEGWPKVIAEAMFWGCVPIATSVSCVPNMLGYGERGIVLKMDIDKDVFSISDLIKNENIYFQKSRSAQEWSRKFTLDTFDEEIKKLLQ